MTTSNKILAAEVAKHTTAEGTTDWQKLDNNDGVVFSARRADMLIDIETSASGYRQICWREGKAADRKTESISMERAQQIVKVARTDARFTVLFDGGQL